MSTFGDSNAFCDPSRVLVQHQAVLAQLQLRLSSPNVSEVKWLDLACGRGQILASLDEVLSVDARAKVAYFGIDSNPGYVEETRELASRLGLRNVRVEAADLAEMAWPLDPSGPFDFITLVNAVHEVPVQHLARLLVQSVLRLAGGGVFHVYDIDRLSPLELGAVTWSAAEIRQIIPRFLDALGAKDYRPEIGSWRHSNCNGWNVQLEQVHLLLDPTNLDIELVATTVRREIAGLLAAKLSDCRDALDSVTLSGASLETEIAEKDRLLHDFWSLSRALRAIQ